MLSTEEMEKVEEEVAAAGFGGETSGDGIGDQRGDGSYLTLRVVLSSPPPRTHPEPLNHKP